MYAITARATIKYSRPFRAVVARSYTSTMHDNDPKILEEEKQRNLRKEQHKTSSPIRNAPGWNEPLATASEAAIKADRSDLHPSELAEHTLRYIKERHRVVNGEERLDAQEAVYERDEISGPLKEKGVEHIEKEVKQTATIKDEKKQTS